MKRFVPVALLLSLALAACGEKAESITPSSATAQPLTLMLDWFPNADHVGIYQALADGLTPPAALRRAKLALLHSHTDFRKPFFWGSFQIYTGH